MLAVVQAIPYETFKEKINITKEHYGKANMEICEGFVYIEKFEEEV